MQANTLQIYSTIEFDLKYDAPQSRMQKKFILEDKYALEELSFIQAIVDNPESVETDFSGIKTRMNLRRSTSLDDPVELISKGRSIFGLPSYEYCIVTSRDLASVFERLVSLKKIQGLDAGVVCIEDIVSNEEFAKGDTISNITDDAGKLRRYLYFAYQNGTRFVLLGGKPPIVPIRYARSYVADRPYDCDIPSDLYFSNIEDNWNKNGDKYYGHVEPYCSGSPSLDRIDFTPQLYVGRLLCKTPLEVINYVNKLEDYSFNPGNGDFQYLVRGFANFTYGFFETDDISVRTWDCDSIILPNMKKCFPKLRANYQKYDYPLGVDVMQMLKDDKFGLISLASHGSPEGVSVKYFYPQKWSMYANGINALDSERVNLPEEEGNGLDNLDNMHYPGVFYTSSCTTMPFDFPAYNGYGSYEPIYANLTYNFGESYILGQNYGGVAFLGNSRLGWISSSYRLEEAFYKLLAIGQRSSSGPDALFSNCGVAEAFSKIVSVSPKSLAYCRLSHNLLGDPAVSVWRQLPSVSGKYVVERDDNVIKVKDEEYSSVRLNRYIVAIEPDGTVKKVKYEGREISLQKIDPSSILYFVEKDYIPVIGNGAIQNTTFNKNAFFHVDNLAIGDYIPDVCRVGGIVNINDSVNVKFDVKGDAWISGVHIKKDAELTLVVNGKCYLNNIQIERNGRLIVYCDSVTRSQYCNSGTGEIIVYKYNKYHEDKSEEVSRLRSRSRVVDSPTLPYTPLLGSGKEWRYNLYNFAVYLPKKEDKQCVLKVEDVMEVDGKQLYSLAMYDENGVKIDDESGYLWEDNENRKVYKCYFEHDGRVSTNLVYDFADPLNNFSVKSLLAGDIEALWSEYSTLDGEAHNRYHFKNQRHSGEEAFQLVEGLGYITSEEYEKDPYSQCVGTLLTGAIGLAAGDCTLPKLYEVVNGDGEVIYSLQAARPGYTSLDVTGAENENVVIDGNSIMISGIEPIGKVSIFNPVGVLVKEENISGTAGEVSVTDLATGVYVVRTAKISRKFVVK